MRLAIALAVLSGVLPAAAQPLAGRATVIDGDTLEIAGVRLRLAGIDAPELAQTCRRDGRSWPCGVAAAAALRAWIRGRPLVCSRQAAGTAGHATARCQVAGADLGEWLAGNGWAVAPVYGDYAYTRAETAARTGRRGLWSGQFVYPWEWRRGGRLGSEPDFDPARHHRIAPVPRGRSAGPATMTRAAPSPARNAGRCRRTGWSPPRCSGRCRRRRRWQ